MKITKIDAEESSATVHWTIDGGPVQLLNLIFDQDGSCSNMSVEATETSAVMPYLNPGSQYSVKLSGLVGTEWVHSDYVYVTI
jgi:hypothetical protein